MKNEKIKLAIIGAGRWGMNHVRTAASLLNPSQIIVCDSNVEAEDKVKSISPEIKFIKTYDEVLTDRSINAVIVATPAETHYLVAKMCLDAGKNVLVEKPITLALSEADELKMTAENNNLKLMVGHVLLFHPAVLRMKEGLENNKIGKLQYIYSNRLNLGAIRSEENILWSFAPHDVSVIQYLVGDDSQIPSEITAHGASYVQHEIEDTTITNLKYPNGVNAHIFVSWLHPFKEQRMVVIGEEGMYVFEDSLKTEKLKFYKKGFRNVNGVIEKFEHDYEVVEFEQKMPLAEEQVHFYDCIINDKEPRTNGQHAYDVLKILVEATESLKPTLETLEQD